MTFDHDLLEDSELLERRDEGRLLWSLAGAGAQVRRAAEVVEEFGVDRLAGAERPRAVLLVGDTPSAGALRVLTRMVLAAAPTTVWSGPELPRWAGPSDALLAASVDGRHPRVIGIVAEATRRGMETCVVAPARSPLAHAAGRSPVADLDPAIHHRAALWAVLTPLLQAVDALGLVALLDGQLAELADALDVVAESCRPTSDVFTNPAKSLAAELAGSIPVIAGAGSLAGVAGRMIADALRLLGGSPAISVTLPDGAPVAMALLARGGAPGASADVGFFRDRIDDAAPVTPPHLLVIGDEEDLDDLAFAPRSDAQMQLDERAARRASSALQDVARAAGVRSSVLDIPSGTPLTRLGAAHAFGLFTATYLALGLGIDPSATRPGELL
jgi:glucose/mannose-6-phosphate isomerase